MKWSYLDQRKELGRLSWLDLTENPGTRHSSDLSNFIDNFTLDSTIIYQMNESCCIGENLKLLTKTFNLFIQKLFTDVINEK